LEISKRGEIMMFPPNNAGTSLCLAQIEVANRAGRGVEESIITYNKRQVSQVSRCSLAAIRLQFEGNSVVLVLGLQWSRNNQQPWCSIVSYGNSAECDDAFTSVKDFDQLPDIPMTFTDRDKLMVSNNRAITAAIRVAASTDLNTARYGLHVGLMEITSSLLNDSNEESHQESSASRSQRLLQD
jgi:hypothetical protein